MARQSKSRRPKSANGNGGARFREDRGIWEWRVTLADGRRYSGYGKSQIDAKQRCLAKVKQAERGIDVKATRQTLGHYLDWWLDDIVTPQLSAKTVKGYRDTVRLHLTPELGPIELGKLTPQAVTSLLRKKERAGLSPRSVAMIREVLRGALNVAIKMQMIERNAAALAQPPRQVKTERRMLTPNEAKRLLGVVEGDRLAALYRVALTLGMRQAEILGLRWQDVDLEAHNLRVRQTLQRIGKEIVIKEPKTERSRRTLALTTSPVTVLVAHRYRQEFEQKCAGKDWQDTGLVFTSTIGTPLDPRNALRIWQKLLADAGLPRRTFHVTRHTAVSVLIGEGVPLKVIQEILGHSVLSTTADVYGHLFPQAFTEAAEAMERALGTGA